VLERGMDRQASPAAADVEQPHSGLELELLADQLELRPLGVLERRRSLLEQRAAVGHRAIQKQGEELVRDVVVVADGLGVATLGVAAPPRAQLGRGRGRKARQPRRSDRGGGKPQAGEEPERGRAPSSEQRDDPVEVVDVDIAADVGAPQPELTGRPQ
jgi:hypothetical protein